jgi:hypothetical protein
MPQTRHIALNPGSRWDMFTVHILDSAASHGRSLATISGLLMTNAHAVYAAMIDTYRNNPGGGFVVMFGNLRAMFRSPTAQETAAGYACILFHVDMAKLEKSQQMLQRFHRDDNKGGGIGGGPGTSVKV